jgi:predicted nucleic acid-binding protein
MKVMGDTNIILDVLFHRSAFFDHSRKIIELVELNRIEGCISASAFTDIFISSTRKLKILKRFIRRLTHWPLFSLSLQSLSIPFSLLPITKKADMRYVEDGDQYGNQMEARPTDGN